MTVTTWTQYPFGTDLLRICVLYIMFPFFFSTIVDFFPVYNAHQ